MTGQQLKNDLAVFYRDPAVEWAPAYHGGLLNWGYWAGIGPEARLTVPGRIQAGVDLYRLVLSAMDVRPGQSLLEVGCGLGGGVEPVLTEFRPAEIHAIDVVESQLRQARAANAGYQATGEVVFTAGSAAGIPYPEGRFDHVYSIEAAQHFPDIGAFAAEAFRVLADGGKLGVSTFFPPHREAVAELAAMLPSFARGIDVGTSLGEFTEALAAAGFADVRVESIGEHVWLPFDEWIVANGLTGHWARNFLIAYRAGLLDYHVVTASRRR